MIVNTHTCVMIMDSLLYLMSLKRLWKGNTRKWFSLLSDFCCFPLLPTFQYQVEAYCFILIFISFFFFQKISIYALCDYVSVCVASYKLIISTIAEDPDP